jgi:hypothetical protein
MSMVEDTDVRISRGTLEYSLVDDTLEMRSEKALVEGPQKMPSQQYSESQKKEASRTVSCGRLVQTVTY